MTFYAPKYNALDLGCLRSSLDELAHLVPVLDDHGEPYRSSGAFVVLFKI